MPKAVIVGAGPAGIAAGAVLADAGMDVTLVDEGEQPGGQIYRAPAAGLMLDMRAILGDGHAAYRDFHAVAAGLPERLDYRPKTLAWNVHGGAVHLAHGGELASLPYDALLLATGAIDRIMPLAGWTLPGVFSLGGTQALLKDQGCLIGRRIVFCGSSPLLYLAALQCHRAGGTVVAVLDTTPFRAKLMALPDMLAAPGTLAQGLRSIAALRRRGVPMVHGAVLDSIQGQDRAQAVVYRTARGERRRIECDGIAYGHGLRAETQLAEVAGAPLRFDAVQRQHLPAADLDGRLGHGLYVAGDGAAIGGAEAAALSGALAGAAILADLGLTAPAPGLVARHRALLRLRRFQRGLATAFAWPHAAAQTLDDGVTVCRCEAVTAGAIRQALRDGAAEANRVKAVTRCGMGRCQGRFCGAALAEFTAGDRGMALDRLRAQPPIKPLPIAAAIGAPL